MTAYPGFDVLECQGLWHASDKSHPQKVLVQLGQDSLVIRARDELILTHWSLHFMQELDAAKNIVVFSPDPQSGERLVIDDELMISALRGETIYDRPVTSTPRIAIGFSWQLLVILLVILVAAGIYWSDSLITVGASLVGASERQTIGENVYSALVDDDSRECDAEPGLGEIKSLQESLVPDHRLDIRLLRNIPFLSRSLPGNLVILNAELLDHHDWPEVIAGYILLEAERLTAEDPLLPFLFNTRIMHLVRIAFGRTMPEGTYEEYAQYLKLAKPDVIPAAVLLTSFREAGFPSTAFAAIYANASTDPSQLLTNDPRSTDSYRPLMSDDAWQSLRTICFK